MFQVHVYDDGDTEIRNIDSKPVDCEDLTFDTSEELATELKDYGHDDDRIAQAIFDAEQTEDWIKV